MRLRDHLLLGLTMSAIALGGCAADEDAAVSQTETTTQTHNLEGLWDLRAVERSTTCPEIGELPPVDPGMVRIERTADGFEMAPVREGWVREFEVIREGVWHRKIVTSQEGCEISTDVQWQFVNVGMTRFEAVFDGTASVAGAECQAPLTGCTVQYAITGYRR